MKLKRVLEYVKGSIDLVYTIGAESLNNIQVHKVYELVFKQDNEMAIRKEKMGTCLLDKSQGI